MGTHENTAISAPENISKDDLGNFKLSCNICKQSLPGKTDLMIHSEHHRDGISFPCVLCRQSFMEIALVFQHYTRDHPKPFICEKCNKAFRDRYDFRNHSTIHIDDRPYICQICSNSFKSLPYLKTHAVRNCERNKPFRCGVCGMEHQHKRCRISKMAYIDLLKDRILTKSISPGVTETDHYEIYPASLSFESQSGRQNGSYTLSDLVICDDSALRNAHWPNQACAMDYISCNHPLEEHRRNRTLDLLEQRPIHDGSIKDPQTTKEDSDFKIEQLFALSELGCLGSERSERITGEQPSVGSTQISTDSSSSSAESADSENSTVTFDEVVFSRQFPAGYAIDFTDIADL